MANTMPNINVIFTDRANTVVARSGRGALALLAFDSHVGNHVLRSLSDLPTVDAGTAEAVKAIYRGVDGQVPSAVYLCLMDEDEEGALQDALTWLATKRWSWLACTSGVATFNDTVVAWIKAQAADNHALYKAVLAGCTANDERIVNFVGASSDVGDDAADWTARIAGMLAAMPITESITYKVMPELSDCEGHTQAEADALVAGGKLFFFNDGQRIRVSRGVTSLTTTTGLTNPEAHQKIHLLEVRDMIVGDLRDLIIESYVGRYPNNYDSKIILVSAIRNYLDNLEAQGILQITDEPHLSLDATRTYLIGKGVDVSKMTDEEILHANTDSHVFIAFGTDAFDAIEDVDVSATI